MAQKNGHRTGGWWSGLSGAGKLLSLVVVLAVAGLVIGLSLTLAGTHPAAKPAPKKPHVVVVKPKPSPPLTFSFQKETVRLDLALQAAGLRLILSAMAVTSKNLQNDLSKAFGVTGQVDGLVASLDILADGPDTTPGSTPGSSTQSGAEIAKLYINKYKAYLKAVTAIMDRAKSVAASSGGAAERAVLIEACNSLSRDINVIIDGLNILASPAGENTGEVARGLTAAAARIDETTSRIEQLLGTLAAAR